eukprot:Rmarinus@m.6327
MTETLSALESFLNGKVAAARRSIPSSSSPEIEKDNEMIPQDSEKDNAPKVASLPVVSSSPVVGGLAPKPPRSVSPKKSKMTLASVWHTVKTVGGEHASRVVDLVRTTIKSRKTFAPEEGLDLSQPLEPYSHSSLSGRFWLDDFVMSDDVVVFPVTKVIHSRKLQRQWQIDWRRRLISNLTSEKYGIKHLHANAIEKLERLDGRRVRFCFRDAEGGRSLMDEQEEDDTLTDHAPSRPSSFEPMRPATEEEADEAVAVALAAAATDGKLKSYDLLFESAAMTEAFLISTRLLRQGRTLKEFLATPLKSLSPSKEDVSVFVATWNLGNAPPPSDITEWLPAGYDIYAIGAQEAWYTPAPPWSSCESHWYAAMEAAVNQEKMQYDTVDSSKEKEREKTRSESTNSADEIPCGEAPLSQPPQDKPKYVRLQALSLWEIRLIVLVREELAANVTFVQSEMLPTGIGGVLGNKGAVAVALRYHETSLCFINTHLAAHQEKVPERNAMVKEIFTNLNLGSHELLHAFDHVFFFGDMNYRLDFDDFDDARASIEVAAVSTSARAAHAPDLPSRATATSAWERLLSVDQLRRELKPEGLFGRFSEPKIDFAPTFKLTRPRQDFPYTTQRIPSYCDRVLWHSLRGGNVEPTFYKAVHNIVSSDHAPVHAGFRVTTMLPYEPFLHSMMLPRPSPHGAQGRGSQGDPAAPTNDDSTRQRTTSQTRRQLRRKNESESPPTRILMHTCRLSLKRDPPPLPKGATPTIASDTSQSAATPTPSSNLDPASGGEFDAEGDGTPPWRDRALADAGTTRPDGERGRIRGFGSPKGFVSRFTPATKSRKSLSPKRRSTYTGLADDSGSGGGDLHQGKTSARRLSPPPVRDFSGPSASRLAPKEPEGTAEVCGRTVVLMFSGNGWLEGCHRSRVAVTRVLSEDEEEIEWAGPDQLPVLHPYVSGTPPAFLQHRHLRIMVFEATASGGTESAASATEAATSVLAGPMALMAGMAGQPDTKIPELTLSYLGEGVVDLQSACELEFAEFECQLIGRHSVVGKLSGSLSLHSSYSFRILEAGQAESRFVESPKDMGSSQNTDLPATPNQESAPSAESASASKSVEEAAPKDDLGRVTFSLLDCSIEAGAGTHHTPPHKSHSSPSAATGSAVEGRGMPIDLGMNMPAQLIVGAQQTWKPQMQQHPQMQMPTHMQAPYQAYPPPTTSQAPPEAYSHMQHQQFAAMPQGPVAGMRPQQPQGMWFPLQQQQQQQQTSVGSLSPPSQPRTPFRTDPFEEPEFPSPSSAHFSTEQQQKPLNNIPLLPKPDASSRSRRQRPSRPTSPKPERDANDPLAGLI